MILPRDRYKNYRKSIFDRFRLTSVTNLQNKEQKEINRILQTSIPNRYEEFEDVILKSKYPTEEDFENYVLEECSKGNPLALILFCKNPSRSTKDQDTQFDFIESRFSDILSTFGKFKLIGGERTYYVNNKLITLSKNDKKPSRSIKSIDFSFTYSILGKIMTGIGTLKYANDISKRNGQKGSGGSQSYQIGDIENSNEEFIKSVDKNLYTFSVVYGNCFSEDVYRDLFKKYKTDRNKISSVDKFGVVLIGTILHWIRETFDGSKMSPKDANIVSEEVGRLQSLLELYKLNLSK